MSTGEWIALLTGIAALVLGGIAYQRSGRPLTLTGVQEAYTSAQSLATELSEVATTAVAAAQQLKDTGKITTGTAAFNHAFDHVNRWFPSLDRQIAANAVEGAYNLYKLSARAALTGGTTAPEPTAEDAILDKWQLEQHAGDTDMFTGHPGAV